MSTPHESVIYWLANNKSLNEGLKDRINKFIIKHKDDIRSGGVGAYLGASMGGITPPLAVPGALIGGALGVGIGRELRKRAKEKGITPASSFSQPRK